VEKKQDQLYGEAAKAYSTALDRLSRAYEADPHFRQDLLQEIHLALWRSMTTFDGRCSLRTWTYRVAHNVATSHVLRDKRARSTTLVSLEELDEFGGPASSDHLALQRAQVLERLYAIIHRLNPIDRQIILLYLEGEDAAAIGEVTGITAGYAATKIHRIKRILTDRFHTGGHDGER
jgi:RNA polymerase sigma-70 factor, ECF subfamily